MLALVFAGGAVAMRPIAELELYRAALAIISLLDMKEYNHKH